MAHLGLVGIGVMGHSLALNLCEEGHTVSLLDRSIEKSQAAVSQAEAENLDGTLIASQDATELVASLPPPRSILLLVDSTT